MKVVLNGKETEIEILEIPFVALLGIKQVCNEEVLRMLVTAGMERFTERKQELSDGCYCCRMVLPELSDENKMVLFILQGQDASVAPVSIMLWREAVDIGLLPLLQAMVNEGSYRQGPDAVAFKDLLAKSGVNIP